jgi:hypothetical protein
MAESRLYKIAHWARAFQAQSAVPGCQRPKAAKARLPIGAICATHSILLLQRTQYEARG